MINQWIRIFRLGLWWSMESNVSIHSRFIASYGNARCRISRILQWISRIFTPPRMDSKSTTSANESEQCM